ncbi:protein kinase domain-containing protein [Streptomyces sp. 8N114]|uniref:protein kinase domain-containing protein n=1 Tax=Streptomyces sp. 8N114 TaxID=3457419 RepID=UPI003FD0F14C
MRPRHGEGRAAPVWSASPYRPALPLPIVIETYGPLPLRTVVAVGTALGEALAHLHASGTAHAGVTAENVLLTGDGPRLAGFGAARVTAPDGEPRALDPFLAPELVTGGRPRPLGDLYGLAVVLTYAMTRQLPRNAGKPGVALGSASAELTRCGVGRVLRSRRAD